MVGMGGGGRGGCWRSGRAGGESEGENEVRTRNDSMKPW